MDDILLLNKPATLQKIDANTALVKGLILYEGYTNYIGTTKQDYISAEEVERVYGWYSGWYNKLKRAFMGAGINIGIGDISDDMIEAYADGQPVKTIFNHNKDNAEDSLGIIVGDLERKYVDGKLHLIATVKVTGKHNIEKIESGAYSSLSLGYSINSGRIYELSVVTIPALNKARFLSGVGNHVNTYQNITQLEENILKLKQQQRSLELDQRILSAVGNMVAKTNLSPVDVQRKLGAVIDMSRSLDNQSKIVIAELINQLTPYSHHRFMQIGVTQENINKLLKRNNDAQK